MLKLNHAELIENERARPADHRKGHDGYRRKMAALRDTFFEQFLTREARRHPSNDEIIAAFGDLPPADLAVPYDLTPEGLEHVSRCVQRKYVIHFKNIRRCWALLLQHMPELMAEGCAPREVLEMSTAHGATLEILRRKGHRVIGNDFANFVGGAALDSRYRNFNGSDLTSARDDHGLHDGSGVVRDWPYRPITESLGLDVRLFDAGSGPYPFADKSLDSVICFDAIEHYCHPRDWMKVVGEFTRIARRSVLVVPNAVAPHDAKRRDYIEAVYAFQRDMRNYSDDGWACVHAGVLRNQLSVFKLMRLG
jgi:hypothetical protein